MLGLQYSPCSTLVQQSSLLNHASQCIWHLFHTSYCICLYDYDIPICKGTKEEYLPPSGTTLYVAQYIKAALVKDTSNGSLGTVDNLYVTLFNIMLYYKLWDNSNVSLLQVTTQEDIYGMYYSIYRYIFEGTYWFLSTHLVQKIAHALHKLTFMRNFKWMHSPQRFMQSKVSWFLLIAWPW